MTFPLYQVNTYEDVIHELEGLEKINDKIGGDSVIYRATDWSGKEYEARYQLSSDYYNFFFTQEEAADFVRRRLHGQIDHHEQQAKFFMERLIIFEQSLQCKAEGKE